MTVGKMIVIEGLDGAGKSTLIAGLIKALGERQIDVMTVREPGGTPTAETLRSILKSVNEQESLTPQTELLLFYAARSQLLENVIKPALAQGKWIIADRFSLSTLAYQGHGLGLVTDVLSLESVVLKDFTPDLQILLEIPIKTMRERLVGRGDVDRIESRGDTFFENVRVGFIQAIIDVPRYRDVKLVNALLSEDALLEHVLSKVLPLLPKETK